MPSQLPVACFAPPLTDELLADYHALIRDLPEGEIAAAMHACMTACLAWWQIPESQRTDGPKITLRHQGVTKVITVTPLEDDQVKQLWDAVPWSYECNAIQALFDTLPNDTPPQKQLRDAAFHLLWHAKELAHDREPLTADKL